MTFEPPVHVFGGFAEDALLHGTSVRTHNDVDVLVGRDELEAQLRNTQAIAFSSPEVRYEPVEGMPMVIGTTNGHLDLEISVYERTPERTIFFHMLDQNGRLVRIDLSDGVFDHPTSTLDGISVRTVSPLALYQIRAGITMAGGLGPPRPKDITSQEALAPPTRDVVDVRPYVDLGISREERQRWLVWEPHRQALPSNTSTSKRAGTRGRTSFGSVRPRGFRMPFVPRHDRSGAARKLACTWIACTWLAQNLGTIQERLASTEAFAQYFVVAIRCVPDLRDRYQKLLRVHRLREELCHEEDCLVSPDGSEKTHADVDLVQEIKQLWGLWNLVQNH